jgi:hypothetical protein
MKLAQVSLCFVCQNPELIRGSLLYSTERSRQRLFVYWVRLAEARTSKFLRVCFSFQIILMRCLGRSKRGRLANDLGQVSGATPFEVL